MSKVSIKNLIDEMTAKVNKDTNCIICQDKIGFRDQVTTFRCSCKYICHSECLQECHKCPTCSETEKNNNFFSIWSDPKKTDRPVKIIKYIPYLYRTWKHLFMTNGCANQLSTINQEMYNIVPNYQYLLISLNQLLYSNSPIIKKKIIDTNDFKFLFKVSRSSVQKYYKYKGSLIGINPIFKKNIHKYLKGTGLDKILKILGVCWTGKSLEQAIFGKKINCPRVEIYILNNCEYTLLNLLENLEMSPDIILYNRTFYINYKSLNLSLEITMTHHKNSYELVCDSHTHSLTHQQFFYEKGKVYATSDAITSISSHMTRTIKQKITRENLFNAKNLGFTVLQSHHCQVIDTKKNQFDLETLKFSEHIRSQFSLIVYPYTNALTITNLISGSFNQDINRAIDHGNLQKLIKYIKKNSYKYIRSPIIDNSDKEHRSPNGET